MESQIWPPPPQPQAPPSVCVKKTQTCRSLPGNRENRENLLKERRRGRGTATERRRKRAGRKEEVIDGTEGGGSGGDGEGGTVSETVRDRSGSRLGEEGLTKPQRGTSHVRLWGCGDRSRHWAASGGLIGFWFGRRQQNKEKMLPSLPAARTLKRWMTKRVERNKRGMVGSDKYRGSGVLHCCY